MRRYCAVALFALGFAACAGSGTRVQENKPSLKEPIYLVDGRVLVSDLGYVAPKLIERAEPVYSVEARRARLQGHVVLSCVVDVDGSVKGVRVVESAGVELDRASIAAVLKWKYEPATLRGEKVAVYFRITVTFRVTSS